MACILHISPRIPSHTSSRCLHGGCMALENMNLNVVMAACAAAELNCSKGFAKSSCKLGPAEHAWQCPNPGPEIGIA